MISRSVVLTDHLQKSITITWAYYVSLLDKLKDAIQAKRPHLVQKVVVAKFYDPRIELFIYESYSLVDLASSYYVASPSFKTRLAGQSQFSSNQETKKLEFRYRIVRKLC